MLEKQPPDARIAKLSAFFEYSIVSGKIYAKCRNLPLDAPIRLRQWETKKRNKAQGCSDGRGYIRVSIPCWPNPFQYIKAHQIAFALIEGYIPSEIDHIDNRKNNNAWHNLRACTSLENQWNKSKRITNTSGYKGVSWHSRRNKWAMQIMRCGKVYHSYHNTKEQAYEAYCIKASELHGEFANVN